jgi:hypothetical protein
LSSPYSTEIVPLVQEHQCALPRKFPITGDQIVSRLCAISSTLG